MKPNFIEASIDQSTANKLRFFRMAKRVRHVRYYWADGDRLLSEDLSIGEMIATSQDCMAFDYELMRSTRKYKREAHRVARHHAIEYGCTIPFVLRPLPLVIHRVMKFSDGTYWMATWAGADVEKLTISLFHSEQAWLLFYGQYVDPYPWRWEDIDAVRADSTDEAEPAVEAVIGNPFAESGARTQDESQVHVGANA